MSGSCQIAGTRVGKTTDAVGYGLMLQCSGPRIPSSADRIRAAAVATPRSNVPAVLSPGAHATRRRNVARAAQVASELAPGLYSGIAKGKQVD